MEMPGPITGVFWCQVSHDNKAWIIEVQMGNGNGYQTNW